MARKQRVGNQFVSSGSPRRGRRPSVAMFESLEARKILGVVSWDGGGDGTSWHDAANWSANTVPGASDDVLISVAGSPTIQFTSTTGSRTIRSLECDEALSLTGGHLTVTVSTDINAALTMSGGTLQTPALDVAGGSLGFSFNGYSRLVGPMAITGNAGNGTGYVRVSGNLGVSGTFNVGAGYMGLEDGARLTGGTFALAGGYVGLTSVGIGSTTGTIGAQAAVVGFGTVGQFVIQGGGTGHVVNQGLLHANAPSQYLYVTPQDTFTNAGTLRVSAGTLRVMNSAAPSWTSTGSMDVTGGALQLFGSFTTADMDLPGLTHTGGTVEILGNLNNAGDTLAFTANTGSMILNGGTITGGTISPSGGNTLQFANHYSNRFVGPVSVAGSIGGGSGSLRVGGNLSVAGTFNVGAGVLGLEDGARLVEGAYSVAGGYVGLVSGGIGTTTGTIGANATVSGFGYIGQFVIQGGGTGSLVNQGLLHANTLNQYLYVTPQDNFTNAGTLRVSAGTLRVMNSAAPSWTSTGSMNVTGGALQLFGTFTTADMDLPGLTHTGGTVEILGNLNNTGDTLAFTANTGSMILNGGTITGGTITPSGGNTLQFANHYSNRLVGPVSVTADIGSGSGALRVSGNLGVNGVFNVGTGVLGLEDGARLTSGTYVLAGGYVGLTSLGTGTTSATIGMNAAVQGYGYVGQFVIQGGGTGALVNLGTIRANTLNQYLYVTPQDTFTNSGALVVTQGTMRIMGSAAPTWSSTGTMTVSGGVLQLFGSFTTAGLNLPGLSRTGGAIEILGNLDNTGATLALTGSTGSFILNGGQITSGTVSPSGGNTLLFANHYSNRLVGPIIVTGGIGNGTGATRLAGSLSVEGTYNVGAGVLGLEHNARLVRGIYQLGGGYVGLTSTGIGTTIGTLGFNALVQGYGYVGQFVIQGGGTGSLSNLGKIRSNANSQVLYVAAQDVFINNGTIEVVTGTLQLGTSPSQYWASPGTVVLINGILRLSTVPTGAIGTLTMSGGVLDGTTLVNITNTLTWTGGSMTGTGATVIVPGATASLAGAQKSLARRYINRGTSTWSAGEMLMTGGKVNNESGATFVVGGANHLAMTPTAGSTGNAINNVGTFRKTGAGAVLLRGSPPMWFNNLGTTDVAQGTLILNGGVAQYEGDVFSLDGGRWIVTGTLTIGQATVRRIVAGTVVTLSGPTAAFGAIARLQSNAGTLNLLSGAALNTAPVSGRFTNEGLLTLGRGSLLNITGGFSQTAAGDVRIDVGGTSDALFGKVRATGSLVLAGDLIATGMAGYTPVAGHSILLIQGGTNRTGAFAGGTYNFASPPTAQLQYGTNLVRLRFV